MRAAYGILGAWLLGALLCVAQETGTKGAAEDPVANLTAGVATLDKTATEQDKRLSQLESKMKQVMERLGGTGSTANFNTFDRRISDLEKKMSRVERDVDQLKSRVNRLESKH